MQLLGQPVRHNAFGTGVITGLSGNIITIDFAQGEKRFQYPDAFSRFLTLKDAGKQNEIRAGYERRLRAERAERQKELERQERLGKIRSMKVTPYSQAAFDIPWKEAKAAAEADAVSTGFYLSGYSKDRPRIPSRLKPNSACLLTTLETGCEEKERRILGAFMVRDDFWGAYCREGMIKAHFICRPAVCCHTGIILNRKSLYRVGERWYSNISPAVLCSGYCWICAALWTVQTRVKPQPNSAITSVRSTVCPPNRLRQRQQRTSKAQQHIFCRASSFRKMPFCFAV